MRGHCGVLPRVWYAPLKGLPGRTTICIDMEEEFDIEIADDDAQKILKVQDAISYIENKQ